MMHGGAWMRERNTVWGGQGQVAMMILVSGTGAGGTSYVPLSGGAPLGPEGALRLAKLLCEARPPLLTSLDLRCRDEHTTHTCDNQGIISNSFHIFVCPGYLLGVPGHTHV